MKATALLFGITAVTAAAAGSCASDDDAAQTESPETLQAAETAGEQSPKASTPSSRFTYFNGEEGSLQDFLGTPLLVNFWASWCGPCVVEMPAFEAVYQEFKDRVAFLGLNINDDRERALELVERTGVTYLVAQDDGNAVMNALGAVSMPTTVLIAPNGETVAIRGSRLRAKDLRNLIEEHLEIRGRQAGDQAVEAAEMEATEAR